MRAKFFGRLPRKDQLESIRASPNYFKGKFQNLSPTPALSEDTTMTAAMWQFMFNKDSRRSPSAPIPHVVTDLHRLNKNENQLVWFGHSSYLMLLHGKSFLVFYFSYPF